MQYVLQTYLREKIKFTERWDCCWIWWMTSSLEYEVHGSICQYTISAARRSVNIQWVLHVDLSICNECCTWICHNFKGLPSVPPGILSPRRFDMFGKTSYTLPKPLVTHYLWNLAQNSRAVDGTVFVVFGQIGADMTWRTRLSFQSRVMFCLWMKSLKYFTNPTN